MQHSIECSQKSINEAQAQSFRFGCLDYKNCGQTRYFVVSLSTHIIKDVQSLDYRGHVLNKDS